MINISIFIFIIILIYVGLTTYIIINLSRKNNILQNFINKMYVKINVIYKTLLNLDQKQMFEHDDDVGILWKEIKTTIQSFNEIFEKESE